jgi:hypothetical protein
MPPISHPLANLLQCEPEFIAPAYGNFRYATARQAWHVDEDDVVSRLTFSDHPCIRATQDFTLARSPWPLSASQHPVP